MFGLLRKWKAPERMMLGPVLNMPKTIPQDKAIYLGPLDWLIDNRNHVLYVTVSAGTACQ